MALCACAVVSAIAGAMAVAHPPAPYTPDGKEIGDTYHGWLHQARVPLVRGRIVLDFGGCPGHPEFIACVSSRQPRRIHIERHLSDPRGTLYHELGHVFDFKVLNRSERRAFKRIMHLRLRRWYGGDPMPAEWFADGYGLCARLGSTLFSRAERTTYGYRPTRRQHAAVCRLIAKAADVTGAAPQPPRKPPAEVTESPPAATPAPSPPPCGVLQGLLGSC